jgi:N-methylhydantoinase B
VHWFVLRTISLGYVIRCMSGGGGGFGDPGERSAEAVAEAVAAGMVIG